MTIALDASATLAWLFEDESTPALDDLFRTIAVSGGLAPTHWRLEVANGLQMAIRKQRADRAFRAASLARLMRLPIEVDTHTNLQAWSTTLALSDRYDLTTYDAAYLELAQRRALPLATLDRRLRDAAERSGVELA